MFTELSLNRRGVQRLREKDGYVQTKTPNFIRKSRVFITTKAIKEKVKIL